MAVKLSNEALSELPKEFRIPEYDRNKMQASIFHIGVSNFSRSHLAVFADDLLHQQHLAGEPLTGGIIGICPRRPDVRDALAGQDFLYSLASMGKNHEEFRVIGSFKDILYLKETENSYGEIVALAADPNITMFTMTVTQKGYNYGANIKSEEAITINLIVDALQLRYENGVAPPTIASLDNFPGNGATTKVNVLACAKDKYGTQLHDWILEYAAFPNMMVDRITPSISKQHIDFVASKKVMDASPVQAEPMPTLPWVMENLRSRSPATNAPVVMPDLESVGVEISDNVSSYENLKLRSLNGAHMALGCIGHLSGKKFSHEAMQDPAIRAYIIGFMAEAGQTLAPTVRDQNDYRADLIKRLDNNTICDPLIRLARDGSKKASSRFLDTLRDCVAHDYSHGHMTFAIASWMEYFKDLDEEGYIRGTPHVDTDGKTIDPNDAKAISLGMGQLITQDTIDPSALFAISEIFGFDLPARKDIVEEVGEHLKAIHTKGIGQALEDFLANRPEIPGLLMNVQNDNKKSSAPEFYSFLPAPSIGMP